MFMKLGYDDYMHSYKNVWFNTLIVYCNRNQNAHDLVKYMYCENLSNHFLQLWKTEIKLDEIRVHEAFCMMGIYRHMRYFPVKSDLSNKTHNILV